VKKKATGEPQLGYKLHSSLVVSASLLLGRVGAGGGGSKERIPPARFDLGGEEREDASM